MPDRKKFKGLTADAFVSDADKWALDKLKKVPLLPQVVGKFWELGVDRWFYCYNMGTSIRCGPNQYKTLHNIMRECASILDMPEPELYVSSNPFPNAFKPAASSVRTLRCFPESSTRCPTSSSII